MTAHIDRCGGRFHRVCRWRWVLAGLESTASPCQPRRKQTDRHMKCHQGPTPPAHGDTEYETSPLTSGKAPPKSKNQYKWIFPLFSQIVSKHTAVKFVLTWSKHSALRYTNALRMLGGSGSPVCWTQMSRGTPNTRRPFSSITLAFLSSLGTVLRVIKKKSPLISAVFRITIEQLWLILKEELKFKCVHVGICISISEAQLGGWYVSFWRKSQTNSFWLRKSPVIVTMCLDVFRS